MEEDWNEVPMTEPGVFEGIVDLSKPYPMGTKAKLNVKFQGNKYNTLLEYTIWRTLHDNKMKLNKRLLFWKKKKTT